MELTAEFIAPFAAFYLFFTYCLTVTVCMMDDGASIRLGRIGTRSAHCVVFVPGSPPQNPPRELRGVLTKRFFALSELLADDHDADLYGFMSARSISNLQRGAAGRLQACSDPSRFTDLQGYR
ncbi:hypothetical protein GGR58DRAFT_504068 [Xylaria digitata]|nr:hypothetical protein GGR58DRAFT_504068 [Xylaria digitata]